MGLTTKLKFGEVDNLSDARFAAGSEANFIGFSCDPMNDFYVEPENLKEITSWIDGVGIVGEFGDQDLDEIKQAIKDFNLDYVQLNETNHYFPLEKLKGQIIQNIDLIDYRGAEDVRFFIEDSYTNITYYMLSLYDEEEMEEFLGNADNKKFVKDICQDLNVFLNFPFTPDNIEEIVETYKPYGINIYTGGEEKTGYKDFDSLIEMVEQLQA